MMVARHEVPGTAFQPTRPVGYGMIEFLCAAIQLWRGNTFGRQATQSHRSYREDYLFLLLPGTTWLATII